MPGGVRDLPTDATIAKEVVRRAMVRCGARAGREREAARIAKLCGPHRTVANVTTTLDALVSDGDATNTGTAYGLTGQGETNFRVHPSPRQRRTS